MLLGRPFLAALRPPNGCKTIEQALPKGFIERTKGRGMVQGDWVQQQLILHNRSVGCFVTHCGAGSLSKALLSESQIVLIPQAVDQFDNARMMSMDLK
ncbi:UDP-glycosyltransferase 79B30 [Bienertia sinuspersici]